MQEMAGAELSAALTELDTLLARRQRSAPDVERGERAERLRRHVADYLVPRARDLDAPLTVVLLGSTGSGKSSLFNSLAARPISPSGVLRPTTRRPVVLVHEQDLGTLERGELLPGLQAREAIHVVRGEGARRGVLVIDAPDFDSVELTNRAMAEELLEAADLVVFVTTAERYADQIPWTILARAQQRGVPMLTVLNRLPPDPGDASEVIADYERLIEQGQLAQSGAFGALEVVPVTEGALDADKDALSATAVEPIVAAFDRLVRDEGARREVARRSLGAALEGLPAAIEPIAAEAAVERAAVDALLATAHRAHVERRAALGMEIGAGTFLRAEVLRQWQDFVGAGQVARILSQGIGRLAATIRSILQPGPPAPATEVREAAFADLVALTVAHSDTAARRTATFWAEDRYGADVVARQPSLWGASIDLGDRLGAELEAWAGVIRDEIGRLGEQRRGVARAASIGVNALGTAAVLAVFTHTGGLTGAEVGITAATAVINQKLLEALFGEANVRSFVGKAREELGRVLDRAFDAEESRFTRALGHLADAQDLAEPLRAAAARIAAAAAR